MLAGVVYVSSVVVLWSFTPYLIKIALRYIDPYTLAFLRLIQGLALVIIMWRKQHKSFRGMISFEPFIFIGGIGIGINYVLFIVALNFTTASMGGLVAQIQFVTLAALAWIVLGEKFHVLKLAGVVTVVAGVSLVFAQGSIASQIMKPEYILGNSLMLIAGIGWGVYALANKSLSGRKSNIEILIPIFAIATLISMVASALQFTIRSPFTIGGIVAIITLGALVTGVGFLLMSAGLKRLNASLVGAITSVTPLFNILVARWLLKENLTPFIMLSAVIILAGILLIVRADRFSTKKSSNTDLAGE